VSLPACRHLIDYLGRVCVLVDDEDGLRLRRDDIADAFIDLQFTSLDEATRGAVTTASLLG
jgi:oxygen-independent coproporphyrinogen-3 oxidase